jgi:hypothetical protein
MIKMAKPIAYAVVGTMILTLIATICIFISVEDQELRSQILGYVFRFYNAILSGIAIGSAIASLSSDD